MSGDKPTYVLHIRPEGHRDQGEAMRSLRSLLKVMLRAFGYRCFKIDVGNASVTAEQIIKEDDE